MKKFIITIIAIFAILACVEISKKDTFIEDLSSFVSTKSSEPLEGTVGMCNTGEEFNRFITFKDNQVNLFYGLIEDGEFQRGSDFYSAPYMIDNKTIITNLSYPLGGEKKYSNLISIIKSDNTFSIKTEKDTFEYVGQYTEDLNEQGILVTVTVSPGN